MSRGATPEPMELSALSSDTLVSILVANYNYERYLAAALDSALRQTYDRIEVIVCDDGSTDDSLAVARPYAADDPRVVLVEKENGGYHTAINAAYARSKGAIVCILDSDDLFAPHKVERTVEALGDRAGFFQHLLEPIDERGASLGGRVPQSLDEGWLGQAALDRGAEGRFAPSSGLSFRREVAELLFPLPAYFRRAGDHYLAKGAQFVTRVAASEEPLARYRLHGSNVTGLWVAEAKSLRAFMDDSALIHRGCKELLERLYGPETAARLRDEDRPTYWDARLGLRILEPSAAEGAGIGIRDLKDKVPNRSRRLIWSVLLALPRPLSRRLLAFWWGDSRLKNTLRSAAGRLRGGRARR